MSGVGEFPAVVLPLGTLVPRRMIGDSHLVVAQHAASPHAERYRRLRLRLEQDTPEASREPRLTLITSAVPGEGKTTTAMNLALAYAEDHECRTLLVGADLRRPSLSSYIAPRPTLGLSEVLSGEVELDHALIQMSDSRLWVLPAGASTETPLELLQTERLGALLAELRRRFDRIVIDAPPTVLFTDAAVLASHADGALLVVRAGATTKTLILRARDSLSGARVLGVVLNGVVSTAVDRYYDGYYHGYDDYRRGTEATA